MFDPQKIKADFPIFKHNPELIYLDSAATTLKPQSVIDKMCEYYTQYSANIKRGIYGISDRATEEYEGARAIVANFIGAKPQDTIFTRGTTESVNLVAYALGRQILEAKDEVVVSIAEHHSNFVPWQQLAFEVGADFKIIDIDSGGRLALGINNAINLDGIITKKTKILALSLVSNVLGTINPIRQIAEAAKKINPNIVIIVDCAQAIGHIALNVEDLGVDFVASSGHKMYGPTGVGVLWGRSELLDNMYPFQYGGEMISTVAIEKTTFADPPEKFEAGTPAIAEVIALGAAVTYLKKIGMSDISLHEHKLFEYALKSLKDRFGDNIHIYGPQSMDNRAGILTFNLYDFHAHDVASILDETQHIASRAGHHCTMPLHTRLGISASSRISFSLYNTTCDVDNLVAGLEKATKTLQR